jgi:hypothetical protein
MILAGARMRSIKAAWKWFCTTPASLAAAFMVLGLIGGISLGSFSFSGCHPLPLQERIQDCGVGDWLERWQTILGSVIAVIAAAAVSVPVFLQLAETRRQAAASAAETLVRVVEPLEAELSERRKARWEFRELTWESKFGVPRKGHRPTHEELSRILSVVDSIKSQLEIASVRNPRPSLSADLRRSLFQHTSNLEFALIEMLQDTVWALEDDTIDVQSAHNRLAIQMNSWSAADDAFAKELRRELEVLWARTRELEDLATHRDRA